MNINLNPIIQILAFTLILMSCGNPKNMSPEKLKKEFLNNHVFIGLTNLNDGFDAETIQHFDENDFEVILSRVDNYGIDILGIEPWLNGEYYDVLTKEDFKKESDGEKWYWKAFEVFTKANSNLEYAASYRIPEEIINN